MEEIEKNTRVSYMQNKQKQNHNYMAIKSAVDMNDLSIQEANEIIMK